MLRLRGILLDFYGTVVHEDTEVVEAICQQVSRSTPGSGISPEEVGQSWWELFSALADDAYGPGFRLQRDLARASLAAVAERYRATADPGLLLRAQFRYWRRPRLYADARELLTTTLPVCVLSDIDRGDLAAALAHLGLTDRFVHVVTSEDARAYKPRAEMFRTALGRLGLGPGEVVHVGDSLSRDVAGALNLGIAAVWVNRDRRPAPQPAPEPVLEVADLGGVLPALARAGRTWFG
jgi:2-haloacid dehalogenase/putative hydrolase of the HAD superfamily